LQVQDAVSYGAPMAMATLSYGGMNRLGRPDVLHDLASVESVLVTAEQKASFLAAVSPHNGDWLHALPITSCGLANVTVLQCLILPHLTQCVSLKEISRPSVDCK